MKTLLVGTHFHPPASLVLQYLPSGTPLTLLPEPDNPFDELAVLVGLDPSSRDWPRSFAEALEPFGLVAEEWTQLDWFALGHLAKTGGKPLAKAGLGCWSGNAEATQSADLAGGWDKLGARLGFTAEGKPTVEWDV